MRRHRPQQLAAQAALAHRAAAAAASLRQQRQHAAVQRVRLHCGCHVGQARQPLGLRRVVHSCGAAAALVQRPRQRQRQHHVCQVHRWQQPLAGQRGERLGRHQLALAVEAVHSLGHGARDGGPGAPPRRPHQARQVGNHCELLHRLAASHVELRALRVAQLRLNLRATAGTAAAAVGRLGRLWLGRRIGWLTG